MLNAVPAVEGGGAAPIPGAGTSVRHDIRFDYGDGSHVGANNDPHTNGGNDRHRDQAAGQGGGAEGNGSLEARLGGRGAIGEMAGEKSKEDEEGEEGEHKMEVQQRPKEDPMVDYTDEFGRIRTIRQRSVCPVFLQRSYLVLM